MSSSNTINFSTRLNKGIERSVAIDALQAGASFLGNDLVYVGLGSLWFQDFVLAHRQLGINTMISIEGNKKIYERAEFNKPLRCVEIVQGYTHTVLPSLLDREDLFERPVVAWLDYDSALDEDRLEELTLLTERLPDGSAILTTFSARADSYAAALSDRRSVLQEFFGAVIDKDDLDDEALRGAGLMRTLGSATLDYLVATAHDAGRGGGFVPALSLMYRDSAPMVTVGGFLPSQSERAECSAFVSGDDWFGFESSIIETQPLTLREIRALSQLVPCDSIKQDQVEDLGFKLDQKQLDFFRRHYSRYPVYAEIV